MQPILSVRTRWVDRVVGVPGAAALGVLLAALAWQRAGLVPAESLERLPGWAALWPMRSALPPEVLTLHEGIFAVVADPTDALLAFPGDMRCGQADMGALVADNQGRFGVVGPPDNADPHLARPVPGRGYPTAVAATLHGIGAPQIQTGSSGPTARWGRDAALGTDVVTAQGRMSSEEPHEDVGEDGLGLAGLAGGVVKRFDVAPTAGNRTGELRVVHTGLHVTGARKVSEVARAMAARFDEFRACAESAKSADGAELANPRVSLAFDVGEDGHVAATGGSAGALEQCLNQSLSRVAFAPGASDVSHVVYPLYFAAAERELKAPGVASAEPLRPCDCGG